MTHETFGRFGILAIFDFESKSAQKPLFATTDFKGIW
jgi:hypothetical protein